MADVAADPHVGRRTPTVSDGRHGGRPLHDRANRCKDHRPAILAIALPLKCFTSATGGRRYTQIHLW